MGNPPPFCHQTSAPTRAAGFCAHSPPSLLLQRMNGLHSHPIRPCFSCPGFRSSRPLHAQPTQPLQWPFLSFLTAPSFLDLCRMFAERLINLISFTTPLPSVQSSSVAQLCPTLCDPMDCSTPGFSVHHQLPECTQTHVHWVGDAIQPSQSLSSPSPPAFNLSHHQGLFKWVSSSHQVAKVLGFSFSISPSNEYSGLISFRMD